MSWEVSTSDMSRASNLGIFRMEESQPFDARVLGWQARAQTHPAQTASFQQSIFQDEFEPLVGNTNKRQRRPSGLDLPTTITLCAAVSLWVMVVVVVGLMYWNVAATVASARDQARPFVQEAVNHTLSILLHADKSMMDANAMVEGAHSVTNQAIPALESAMNRSAMIIERLETLAQHPVLQLSLAQG